MTEKISSKITKNLILTLCLIVALTVCLVNFGKDIEAPWPLSMQTNDEKEGNENDKNTIFKEGVGGVILDKGSTRATFIDKNKKVLSIHKSDIFTESVVYYYEVAIGEKNIYIATYECYADTSYFKNQKITKYELDGTEDEVVWEKNYSQDYMKVTVPRVFNVVENEGDVYAIYIDEEESCSDIIDISNAENKVVAHFDIKIDGEIYDADYNNKTKKLGIISELGNLQIYQNNKLVESQNNISPNINYVHIKDDGSCELLEKDYQTALHIDSVDYSIPFIIHIWLFWISVIFVVVYALIKIIKLIVMLFKKGQTKKLARGAMVVIAIVGILGLSGYYSINIMEQDSDARYNALALDARSAKTFMDSNVVKKSFDYSKENTYLELKKCLQQLRQDNIESNYNIEYILVYHDNNDWNQGVVLASTIPETRVGTRYFASTNREVYDGDMQKQGFEEFSVVNSVGETLVAQQGLTGKEGIPQASIFTTSDLILMEANLLSNVIDLFVCLLIVIITIILLCMELGSLYSSHKRKKQFIAEKVQNPEIAFSRTFVFLVTFASSFDGALMVLIAKDMLSNGDLANNTLLLGIPATLLSFGMLLGKPIYAGLSRKISVRNIIICTSIALAISYYFSFKFVADSNFIGYCTSILFSGISTGMLYCVRYNLPILSPNSMVRFEMNNAGALASISGNVLSIGIAGFIAGIIGSEYIYIMAIVIAALVFALAMLVFPKKVKYNLGAKKQEKVNMKDNLKFIFNPPFLIFLIFVVWGNVAALGYSSFIFPLLSDDEGISKTMMSNFIVLANFVAFISNQYTKKLLLKKDFFKMGVTSAIAIGLVFVSMMINDTIAWAVLVIALTVILTQVGDVCANMLWPRLCRNKNFPEHTCNEIILFTWDVAYISKNIVLGALVAAGIQVACLSLGMFFVVGGILLFVTGRYSGFATSDNR